MAERCADVEPLLSAWIDAELDADERAVVDAHLAACGGCRADAAGLARTRAALGNAPVRRLPADVALRPAAEPGHPAARRLPTRAGVAALVAVGFLGGVAYQAGDAPDPGERTVQVPVEAFVVDHLVHAAGDTTTWPMVVGTRP